VRYARGALKPVHLLVAAALLLPAWSPAAADEPGEPVLGFAVGARVSAAFPMGSVLSDPGNGTLLIDELVAISVPLQLDIGMTVHRRWFVGAYAQYAWSFLQIGQCKVGQSCSVTGLHVGLEATYAFRDHGGPWVGLGTGWEWMFTSYSTTSYKTNLDVSGWEYAIFQAGWEVELAPGWMAGPFFTGSIGEFSRASMAADGQSQNSSIPNKALHGWIQLGIKGSFSL